MDKLPETADPSLKVHEANSTERYEMLRSDIHKLGKETIMSDGVQDKVDVQNIFKPGADGHGAGGNIWASVLPAIMNSRHDGFGGSGAAWGLGGLVAGALLSGRRGLFGGGGDGDNNPVFEIATTQGIGDVKASVALSAAQTENVVNTATNNINTSVLQQTISLQNQGFQSQLASQAGFAAVKDSVQATGVINLQATNGVALAVERSQGAVIQAINADGEKTRSLITSNEIAALNRQLTDANAAIIELRNESRLNERTRGIEINMTNNQNQAQFQAQQQAQLQGVLTTLTALAGELQVQRQGIINLGTMVGNTQSAAQTSVR